MEKLKNEIKKMGKKKPGTQEYCLNGKEWQTICNEFGISNKYFLENDEYYTGGINYHQQGYKQLVIIDYE